MFQMSFKQVILATICFLCLYFPTVGQETLGPLSVRAEQFTTDITDSKQYGSRSETDSTIQYLLNTLELPIIDDFSKNHLKVFHKDFNHPSIFDSSSYLFKVNGLPLDSVEIKFDSTFNYIVDPVSGNLDSTLADPLIITFFDTAEVFIVRDSLIAYPTKSQYIQNGVVRTIEHAPDSILYNSKQSNFYGRDDDFSLWIGRGPFLNYTLAIEQPTLGVLTFDGLDSNGLPYDNSSNITYGISDYLISKPINLFDKQVSGGNRQRYSLNDSIYLSFFYQPEGNGDLPEEQDSLILEFYNLQTNRWNRVWGVGGDTTSPFERVSIHIKDTFYLQNGFRFRFKNYATQSGNFDHWHLDYIRLIEQGGQNDEIKDFAIVNPISSMLRDYTAMPYEHYKTDPYRFMKDTVKLELRNLSLTSDILTSRYKVYQADALNYSFISNQKVQSSVEKRTTLDYEIRSAPNNFQFPSETVDREYFKVQFETFSSQDVYRSNDTLDHFQIFDRYYSYDDNSAEKTYHLNLIGTNLAVRFNSPVRDTLKSVLINFVQTFQQTNQKHRVNIKVYNGLQAGPIFESGSVEIQKNAPGTFMRYRLPEPIIVEGDFHIGWEQESASKTFVGYDVNNNNQSNTFISEVDGVWSRTIFNGTVMIRADFGDGSEKPLSKKQIQPKGQVKLYPNPSNGSFRIDGINTEAPIFIYNLQGNLVLKAHAEEGEAIDISELKNGIYFIQSQGLNNTPNTNKLILTK